jgi:hypothetical protein
VLKINPETEELSFLGTLPKGREKWQGGFLGSDENIYCLPETADAILKIIPSTQEVVLIDRLSGPKERTTV